MVIVRGGSSGKSVARTPSSAGAPCVVLLSISVIWTGQRFMEISGVREDVERGWSQADPQVNPAASTATPPDGIAEGASPHPATGIRAGKRVPPRHRLVMTGPWGRV